ncbi:MAG: methylmalonyl-CoA mutase [Desulfobacteraceae bacterium]|nr:methylmalonyl-CoA mutase [Desulfobacteraceae bacterium]
MSTKRKIPRILLAKIGLDGHSRGAYVVADGLRNAGMEVIYTGLRQLPAMVATAAVQEDVDVIGVSSMAGAHISLAWKLTAELEKHNALDIPIIIGGIIPNEDHETLKKIGIKKIFLPGTEVKDMVDYIETVMEGKCGNLK